MTPIARAERNLTRAMTVDTQRCDALEANMGLLADAEACRGEWFQMGRVFVRCGIARIYLRSAVKECARLQRRSQRVMERACEVLMEARRNARAVTV